MLLAACGFPELSVPVCLESTANPEGEEPTYSTCSFTLLPARWHGTLITVLGGWVSAGGLRVSFLGLCNKLDSHIERPCFKVKQTEHPAPPPSWGFYLVTRYLVTGINYITVDMEFIMAFPYTYATCRDGLHGSKKKYLYSPG